MKPSKRIVSLSLYWDEEKDRYEVEAVYTAKDEEKRIVRKKIMRYIPAPDNPQFGVKWKEIAVEGCKAMRETFEKEGVKFDKEEFFDWYFELLEVIKE